jgi:hypothetical protein
MRILIKFLIFAISVLAIIWYCYYNDFIFKKRQIVTLYPDKGETKIKPLDSGGIVLPNSNSSIYESFHINNTPKKQVVLLPEPEKPIIISAAKDQEDQDIIDQAISSLSTNSLIDQGVNHNDNKSNLKGNLPQAKPAQNVLNIITIKQEPNKLTDIINNKKLKKYYKLQLTSVKSRKQGKEEWRILQQKHAKLLGNLQFSLKKMEIEKGKIFYLLLAGKYNTVSEAKLMCKKINRRQQNCVIYQDSN